MGKVGVAMGTPPNCAPFPGKIPVPPSAPDIVCENVDGND